MSITHRISAIGATLIITSIVIGYGSFPKIFALGIYGEEKEAIIYSAFSITKRECQTRNLLCDLKITDQYVGRRIHKLRIGTNKIAVEENVARSKGDIVKVLFTEKYPDYVHVIGSIYQNMYTGSIVSLVTMLMGLSLSLIKLRKTRVAVSA